MLRLQSDFFLLVLGDLLFKGGPVVGTIISIIPSILVGHMQLLEAVSEVGLTLTHVALDVVVLLLHLLELEQGLLLLSIEPSFLLAQRPVLLLPLFVGLLCLHSLSHLVLEVVLGPDKLVLGELQHLGLELLEEPGRGKLGFYGLRLRL